MDPIGWIGGVVDGKSVGVAENGFEVLALSGVLHDLVVHMSKVDVHGDMHVGN